MKEQGGDRERGSERERVRERERVKDREGNEEREGQKEREREREREREKKTERARERKRRHIQNGTERDCTICPKLWYFGGLPFLHMANPYISVRMLYMARNGESTFLLCNPSYIKGSLHVYHPMSYETNEPMKLRHTSSWHPGTQTTQTTTLRKPYMYVHRGLLKLVCKESPEVSHITILSTELCTPFIVAGSQPEHLRKFWVLCLSI